MNLTQRLTAYVLLTLFLFVSAPVHLIHELVHHHDTVESRDHSLVVEVQHIHCESLQLSLPAFSETQSLDVNDVQATTSFKVNVHTTLSPPFAFSINPSGRAPPVLV